MVALYRIIVWAKQSTDIIDTLRAQFPAPSIDIKSTEHVEDVLPLGGSSIAPGTQDQQMRKDQSNNARTPPG